MCAVSFHGSAFLINFEIPKASATRSLISLVRVVCPALIEIATNIYLKSDHKDSLSLSPKNLDNTLIVSSFVRLVRDKWILTLVSKNLFKV